jgi:hypothetical protein
MAEVWPVKLTGADKAEFGVWLARCQAAGAAHTMTDAIRLGVRLAAQITDEDLRKMRAGNNHA